MNSKLKLGLGATTIGVTLMVVLVLSLVSLPVNNPAIVTVVRSEEGKATGHVTALVWRDGELIYEYETHNILVTIGSTWVKEFLRIGTAGATNPTDDIAIGTHGTPVIGDTKLDSEQTAASLIRTSGTATSINATAYNVTYTWTSAITATVNATSLHHDPTSDSDGNAVCIANVAEVSLIANDKLQIIWELNVPAG